MAIWDDVLTERDKQVFAAAGYGKRQGFGRRPAVMVVDVNYNFVGDVPEPILDSIKKYRNSCGEEGWQAVGGGQGCESPSLLQYCPVASDRLDGWSMAWQK
jgi:hypothetical protein